ncbi:stalk domain-containing protein [Paenibacillus sp. y28]|uniref:stalk domain-containing protein n=1 Tax=Paenibacillus sp. y28 TaxID=3129110 RepID=UPI003018EC5B
MKKWMAAVAISTLIVQAGTVVWVPQTGYAATAAASSMTLIKETPITSGAILKDYSWSFERNKKPVQVQAHVIQVDLQNPLVKLDTIAGTGQQYTKRQTALGMANENGAVAATNGDFYNMQAEGVPMGPQVIDGKLTATPSVGLNGFYSFGLTKENKPVIDLFSYEGTVKTADGATFPLGGINKTYYWTEPDGTHTHKDGLFMYTDKWGQVDRSNDGVSYPTEVLVQNGVIVKVAPGDIIDMIAPKDGYILRAAGKADEFVRAHMKEGDKLIADYRVFALDNADKYDVSTFNTMIGGHTILVDQGQPAEFSRNTSEISGGSAVARTAIGYTKDERYVYVITVDKNSTSTGVTLAELQQLMIKLDTWKGMNLDGGGSTEMAVRPLGEFATQWVSNQESRRVVNGVAVYSTAPEGKEVQWVELPQKQTYFVNEKVTLTPKKAYDEYYNPLDPKKVTGQWTMSSPIGSIDGNILTAKQKGTTQVTFQNGTAQGSMEVQILGREDISKLEVSTLSGEITDTNKPLLKVTTTQGDERVLAPESIQWEKRKSGEKEVWIARVDGFSTIVTTPVTMEKLLADFDATSLPVSFSSLPLDADIQGTAQITAVPGDTGSSSGKAAVLNYDMSRAAGTKNASIQLNGQGIELNGQPLSMKLRLYGDSSNNWFRAELTDATKKSFLVDIARPIDWTGWKDITVDFSSYGMQYPVTLKRLYIASPLNEQNERKQVGMVAVDNLSIQYQQTADQGVKPLVKLAIDRKELTADGKQVVLDQAPVIVQDNTMVPIRFITEALGGQLAWDEQERKVSILRGTHFVELWVGQKDLVADGKRTTAEVAPLIMNERTMVPLRMIAEKMGWQVGWDASTYSITLQ